MEAKRIIEQREQDTLEMPPPARSENLDDLIRDFIRVADQVREAGAERRELADILAGKAWEGRGDATGTGRLQSSTGEKIKVEFRSEYKYETEQMMIVSNLLNEAGAKFDDLFTTKIEFAAKRRNLTAFLSTVSADERIETAKQIIRDATTQVQLTPYVSVEKR